MTTTAIRAHDRVAARVDGVETYGTVQAIVQDWSHQVTERPGEHDLGQPATVCYLRLDSGDEISVGLGQLRRVSTAGTCDP